MSAELLPAGSYRVGDAERSRTTELLKEAHVAGYLTLAEIDERLSAALAARTRDELERLVADLPPDWRARQAGARRRAASHRPAGRLVAPAARAAGGRDGRAGHRHARLLLPLAAAVVVVGVRAPPRPCRLASSALAPGHVGLT